MIVVDASVVAGALIDDESEGASLRDRLRGIQMTAPELLDVEVLSVIRRLVSAGQVTEARAEQAAGDLFDLPVERASHRPLITRCWQLRNSLSPYDAAYVALAEALDTTLLTADERLAQAPGPTCRFEVVATTG